MRFKAYIPLQRKTPHVEGITQGEDFVLWNMDFNVQGYRIILTMTHQPTRAFDRPVLDISFSSN